MLTRRHIRIKVIQSVYSFLLGKGEILKLEVDFFKNSVIKTFDLYILLLELFRAIKKHSEEQLIAYEKNKIKIDENYLGLKCLSKNKILNFIDENIILQKRLKKEKFTQWDLEFTFIKDLVAEITASEGFKKYLKLNSPDSTEDKQWLVKCFKEIIAPSSYLFNYLEDHQLTWIDDLPVVNTFLLKMLKQINIKKPQSLPFPKTVEKKEDLEFGVELLEKTITNNEQLLKELEGKTPNWDSDRIAQLDQVILKTAIAELLYFQNIPTKVTLNEYLEIAKDYSTPKSNNFINGVLDKLVREFIHEKRIIKTGRGLL